ncbi:hypothetical protein Tco_0415425, partial [Tanacetum coccineum]
ISVKISSPLCFFTYPRGTSCGFWPMRMRDDVELCQHKSLQIKERLKAARDRQKSYANKRQKPLEFNVGDKVLLKVSPWKGVVHFGKRRKHSPRYVGPFEIVERVDPIAYRLRLPQELVGIHDMFHVSKLKKCLADVNLQVPLEEITNSCRGPEFTWEREDEMKRKYPQLFASAES